MKIHLKYEHTPELAYDFAIHYWKSKRLLKLIFGAIVVVLLVQLVITFLRDGSGEEALKILMPIGMILVIWLWLIPASLKKQLQRADQQSKLGTAREMIFEEEEMLIKTANSESTFDYEGLLHYGASEKCYFLYIGTNQAMIIPKAAFGPGEEEAFRELLLRKEVPFL